jgi:hypothetical protein
MLIFMRLHQFLLILAFVAGPGTSPEAQFLRAKKCVNPDSLFHNLQQKNLNFWVSGGVQIARMNEDKHINPFTAIMFNILPVKYLEAGIHAYKYIPVSDSFSYRLSHEYVPYVRYTFMRNGCYNYAIFADISYHFEKKTSRNKYALPVNESPSLGFGVYKTAGKNLFIEFHTDYYLREQLYKGEIKLTWKLLNLSLRK